MRRHEGPEAAVIGCEAAAAPVQTRARTTPIYCEKCQERVSASLGGPGPSAIESLLSRAASTAAAAVSPRPTASRIASASRRTAACSSSGPGSASGACASKLRSTRQQI